MGKSTWLIISTIAILLVALSCSKPNEPEEITNTPTSPVPVNGSTISIPNFSMIQIPDVIIFDTIGFSWDCLDAELYHIYFDKTPDPALVSSSYTKSFDRLLTSVTDTGTYYWKIVAEKEGEFFESAVWNFHIRYSNVNIYDSLPVIDTTNLPGFILTKHKILTDFPSDVNILLQVTDGWGKGIDSFQTSDFEVLEDDSKVSPTEAFMQIKKKDIIPYTLKTILLLDNSLSVASDISQIKEAAISLVENIEEKQVICIYKFSSQPVLLQHYTNDVQLLKDAINSIEPEFASTNLYGSIETCLSQWNDRYNMNYVEQGFLTVLTDGSDTQGSSTLQNTLATRGIKKIYTIGLGNEIEPDVLSQLGNAGFFPISNADSLKSIFDQIQNEMKDYANSFYWLNYTSPKRENINHTLTVSLLNNEYTGESSSITGEFNSGAFCDVLPGTFINIIKQCDEKSKYGNDSLVLIDENPFTLEATTYLGNSYPYYKWSNSNRNAIDIDLFADVIDNYNNYIIDISPTLNSLKDTTTIKVEDTANGFSKELFITTFLGVFEGFEDGMSDDWTTGGTADWKIIDSISASGNSCSEFSNFGASQNFERNFIVPGNKQVTITFKIHSTEFSSGLEEYFGLYYRDGLYLNIYQSTSDWTEYSVILNSNLDGTLNLEWRYTSPLSNDVYIWIDDINLTW